MNQLQQKVCFLSLLIFGLFAVPTATIILTTMHFQPQLLLFLIKKGFLILHLH